MTPSRSCGRPRTPSASASRRPSAASLWPSPATPGGRVEVRVGRDGSRARVAVSDTGKGLSPEFVPHVFERFRQADAKTTRAFDGLGLGLAIVRHLLEAHGGTVHAESAGEGQGATFSLYLPLSAVRESVPAH